MELNKYNILLKSVEYKDIEMIRLWRNSKAVNQFMEFKGHITIEMQKRWFHSLGENDYYFIVYHDNYPIGLTEIKNIKKDVGNLGIFISDEESLTSLPMVSYRIIFSIIDFAFETLKLNKIEASIMKDNIRAIRFNESIGFKILNNQEDLENQYYHLEKEDYDTKSKKIKKMLMR